MKSLALIMSLSFSIAAFAETTPTAAVKALLPVGEYGTSNCSISVSESDKAVTIKVTQGEETNSFTVVDEAYNYSSEFNLFSAVQNIPSIHPRQKSLILKKLEKMEAYAFISNVYLDSNGDDHGTYTECLVSRSK